MQISELPVLIYIPALTLLELKKSYMKQLLIVSLLFGKDELPEKSTALDGVFTPAGAIKQLSITLLSFPVEDPVPKMIFAPNVIEEPNILQPKTLLLEASLIKSKVLVKADEEVLELLNIR